MGWPLRDEILKRSVAERLELVEDIWDSIAEESEVIELTDAQKAELDRRLEAYHQNPGAGSPWEEALARVRPGAEAPG